MRDTIRNKQHNYWGSGVDESALPVLLVYFCVIYELVRLTTKAAQVRILKLDPIVATPSTASILVPSSTNILRGIDQTINFFLQNNQVTIKMPAPDVKRKIIKVGTNSLSRSPSRGRT
jgi:hypothetical protein